MGKVKEMKADIEAMLFDIYKHIGIDKPENHDDILEFVFNDVVETADPEGWHSGDVAIGFRRWTESRGGEKDFYFLFGEEVCRLYHDESVEAAVKFAKKDGGYGLYHYNTKTNTPDELLAEFEGWSEYAQLTKEEYDQF
jgi:hypothetical protein